MVYKPKETLTAFKEKQKTTYDLQRRNQEEAAWDQFKVGLSSALTQVPLQLATTAGTDFVKRSMAQALPTEAEKLTKIQRENVEAQSAILGLDKIIPLQKEIEADRAAEERLSGLQLAGGSPAARDPYGQMSPEMSEASLSYHKAARARDVAESKLKSLDTEEARLRQPYRWGETDAARMTVGQMTDHLERIDLERERYRSEIEKSNREIEEAQSAYENARGASISGDLERTAQERAAREASLEEIRSGVSPEHLSQFGLTGGASLGGISEAERKMKRRARTAASTRPVPTDLVADLDARRKAFEGNPTRANGKALELVIGRYEAWASEEGGKIPGKASNAAVAAKEVVQMASGAMRASRMLKDSGITAAPDLLMRLERSPDAARLLMEPRHRWIRELVGGGLLVDGLARAGASNMSGLKDFLDDWVNLDAKTQYKRRETRKRIP